jgi:hypothetical protein
MSWTHLTCVATPPVLVWPAGVAGRKFAAMPKTIAASEGSSEESDVSWSAHGHRADKT